MSKSNRKQPGPGTAGPIPLEWFRSRRPIPYEVYIEDPAKWNRVIADARRRLAEGDARSLRPRGPAGTPPDPRSKKQQWLREVAEARSAASAYAEEAREKAKDTSWIGPERTDGCPFEPGRFPFRRRSSPV